jgi:predicted alpha/beta-fold hydrolase
MYALAVSRGLSRSLAVSRGLFVGAPRSLTSDPTDFFSSVQVETIFAALFRSNPHLTYEREIITMPDGGVVALDSEASTDLPTEAPVLVLLPGLTGGSGDT